MMKYADGMMIDEDFDFVGSVEEAIPQLEFEADGLRAEIAYLEHGTNPSAGTIKMIAECKEELAMVLDTLNSCIEYASAV